MKLNLSMTLPKKISKNKPEVLKEYNTKIYKGDATFISPLMKFGLFAIRPIKAGEVVFVVKGDPVHIDIKNKKESMKYPNAIGVSRGNWVNPHRGNPLVYLNHSCEPNAGVKGSVTIVSLRNIKKGEHITIDYSTTECDELWSLEVDCECGEKKCRKVIGPIQPLPVKIYKRYLPYIPKAFQAEYKKANPDFVL